MSVTPLHAALDVLDRAERLLTLDSGSATAPLLDYDARRQALVMGIASLDTWMHWKIRRVDLAVLSRKMQDLRVPFDALVEMGQRSIDARRSGIEDRPMVRARNELNEQILRMTFQSGRQWEDGFALLGVRSGLASAGAAMFPSETKADVEDRLNRLSHRRNLIVHEGDLRRLVRPQRITRNNVSRADVDGDLIWIRRFLVAANSIA